MTHDLCFRPAVIISLPVYGIDAYSEVTYFNLINMSSILQNWQNNSLLLAKC